MENMTNSSFFNILDYIYIAVMLLSSVSGFSKGFTKIFLNTCAWFSSGFVAAVLEPRIEPLIHSESMGEHLSRSVATTLAYVISLIGLMVITGIISNRVKQSILSDLDKSSGALVGVVRGVALPVIVCGLMIIVGIPQSECEYTKDSRISTMTFDLIMPMMAPLMKSRPLQKYKALLGQGEKKAPDPRKTQDKRNKKDKNSGQKDKNVRQKQAQSRRKAYAEVDYIANTMPFSGFQYRYTSSSHCIGRSAALTKFATVARMVIPERSFT
jgi:membrane protein required for colicin V production